MFQPQHFTRPTVVSAQACWAPTEIEETPDVRPVGGTGTELGVSRPSPSCPSVPAPQHRTPPEVVSAHVNVPPAETAFTPELRPVTETGVELFDVPLPGELPQHLRPLEVVSAQLRLPPAETAATFEESPDTLTGFVLDEVDPVPSSPASFNPQHFAALLGPVRAHVWPKPAEIDNAVDGEAAPPGGAETMPNESAPGYDDQRTRQSPNTPLAHPDPLSGVLSVQ